MKNHQSEERQSARLSNELAAGLSRDHRFRQSARCIITRQYELNPDCPWEGLLIYFFWTASRLSSRAKLVFSPCEARIFRERSRGISAAHHVVKLASKMAFTLLWSFVNRTRKVAQFGDLPRLPNGVDNDIINNSMLRGTGICTFPKGVL